MKQIATGRRTDAERAAEHYLYRVLSCEIEQIRRAVRVRFQSVDFWGCDVMGRHISGHAYYAQVTAGQTEAVRTRRRKLEKISWNEYDHVYLLQLVERKAGRGKDFFFRVHRFHHQPRRWDVDDALQPVPREWFRKLRIEG